MLPEFFLIQLCNIFMGCILITTSPAPLPIELWRVGDAAAETFLGLAIVPLQVDGGLSYGSGAAEYVVRHPMADRSVATLTVSTELSRCAADQGLCSLY
jgi:hypothetical protein